MVYSIPYISVVCFLGVCAYIYGTSHNAIHKNRIIYLAVAVFFVFFAFRGYIFSDWTSYYTYFQESSFQDITNYKLGGTEPGFVILNIACKSIFHDFHFFVFICSSINTILLLRFFKQRLNNLPLALMIFFVFDGLIMMTNLMRNSIAILLFLNALTFLERRKPIPYFSICLLALSFHISAIAYFPIYFFFHINFNRWIYLGFFIFCNIIFLSHASVFLSIASALGIDALLVEKVHVYTESYTKSTALSIGYLERLMTGLLVFCYYEKLKSIRKENVLFINSILIYFAFFFLFSEFEVLSKRLAILFEYGYWIIWYDIIKCFSYRNNRTLFEMFIMLYCIFKMTGINYPDADYDNILFGAKSYEERLYLYNKNFKKE